VVNSPLSSQHAAASSTTSNHVQTGGLEDATGSLFESQSTFAPSYPLQYVPEAVFPLQYVPTPSKPVVLSEPIVQTPWSSVAHTVIDLMSPPRTIVRNGVKYKV
jgi:hypothetical protein